MTLAFLKSLWSRPAAPLGLTAPEALAALLVHLARAEGAYGPGGAAAVEKGLGAHYALAPAAAAALRARGEGLEAGAPDIVRFTRVLKAEVPLAARGALAEALWAQALADGMRAAEEEQILRQIGPLLGLSDVALAKARQRVEKRAPLGPIARPS